MPIFYFVPDREADTFKMPLTAERLLRSLGATGKLAGFRCTVYMIERIQENPEQLQLITKRLYIQCLFQINWLNFRILCTEH